LTTKILKPDIRGFLAEGSQPTFVLDKKPASVWRVRNVPFYDTASDDPWVTVRGGEFVRIPLHPYILTGDPVATSTALMRTVWGAFDAAADCHNHLFLVGEPAEFIDRGARVWIGFAAEE
jgi:hypothetical protein